MAWNNQVISIEMRRNFWTIKNLKSFPLYFQTLLTQSRKALFLKREIGGTNRKRGTDTFHFNLEVFRP